MTASKVRADYEMLAGMAQTFGRQADCVRRSLGQMKECTEALERGDWIGKGADTFYREMNSDVLPAVTRLAQALERASATTRQISQIMKRAEEDAARLFKLEDAGRSRSSSNTSLAGAAGGGTGGGQGAQGGSGPAALEPTLAEAARQGIGLPKRSLEKMDVERLDKMSPEERQTWYTEKLGPYARQIQESAEKYGIPPLLLTTLLLNELADINWTDTIQDTGSLGIAQLQIDTVIEDDLMPELKHWDDGTDMPHGGRDTDVYNRVGVAEQLQIPQHAIDAAAKEISLLLAKASQNTGQPWQKKFGFKGLPGQPADGSDWYSAIDGPTLGVRQHRLAQMMAAAYNSPDILITSDPGEERYPNANAHGSNAASIADDLFQMTSLVPGTVGR